MTDTDFQACHCVEDWGPFLCFLVCNVIIVVYSYFIPNLPFAWLQFSLFSGNSGDFSHKKYFCCLILLGLCCVKDIPKAVVCF